MSVGMPQSLHLQTFGEMLYQAFGEMPYHVGSSLNEKLWRDVDVRMMLPDELYTSLGLGDPSPNGQHLSPRWRVLCMAFSAMGKQMTGLPIDFQLQQHSQAIAEFGGCPRSALFEHYRVK